MVLIALPRGIHALRVIRLRQAALALQYTNDRVEKIAEDTGFTSLSHLSREFRRQFGASPRATLFACIAPSPNGKKLVARFPPDWPKPWTTVPTHCLSRACK